MLDTIRGTTYRATLMGHPPARQLAEHLVPDFTTWIADQRAQGTSWERIGRHLATKGVDVSSETLRRWFPDLTAEPTEAAS